MKNRSAINDVLMLNVSNSKIDEILNTLRHKYKYHFSSPHITLRGPQRKISIEIIKKTEEILLNMKNKIEVDSIDIFQVGEDYFCVFRLNAPSLRKVWRKPDFPIRSYGYNPHITLFKGNKNEVYEVKDYIEKKLLKNKNINIYHDELTIESKRLLQPSLDL